MQILKIVILFAIKNVTDSIETQKRHKRYLLFTPDTQFGIFVTVAIPLESQDTVSVAWFIEANYYNVDNSTYFEPLLGDIETSSKREHRAIDSKNIITRRIFYTFIENMFEKHGYSGRSCLLRAICEHASLHFLNNGVLGDLLYIALTPSTSISEEDIEDCYYEAEYWGLEHQCHHYEELCPSSPLDYISVVLDNK